MKSSEVKKISKYFLTKKVVKKIIAYLFLLFFAYLFKDFLFIFFLTFIFAYLFLSFWEYLKKKIDLFIDKSLNKNKFHKFLKKWFSLNVIVLLEYIIFVWMLIFIFSNILPKFVDELIRLPEKIPFVKNEVDGVVEKLQDLMAFNTEIWWTLSEVVSTQDMWIFFDVFQKLKTAWIFVMQIVLSIILSYVFIVDRQKLKKYFLWIKNSNFEFFYYEYENFFSRLVKSFWLILKAQSLISLANTVLTTIWLYIVWNIYSTEHYFPYLLTLIIIVFICWFIPVLGTFISSVPIFLIWYQVWWLSAILSLTLVITIVHFVEAYYLNPKIVSSFLNLPVSLTFIILIVSEHLFWIPWLLVWISVFYFLEWVLKDTDKSINEMKEKL